MSWPMRFMRRSLKRPGRPQSTVHRPQSTDQKLSLVTVDRRLLTVDAFLYCGRSTVDGGQLFLSGDEVE